MRWWIGLAMLAAIAAPARASDADDLAALLKANSWPVVAGETGLGGPGADRIAAWSDEAVFFLLGENHGNAGMARFATALARTLGKRDYRYTAVETDPLVTEVMTGLMRSGKPALAAWLNQDHRQRAIPFYFWSEEADFIAAALANGPVWGLDQSFIGAAHVHLEAIAAATRSPRTRTEALALADEARKDIFGFLGKVDLKRLKDMRAAMPRMENPRALELARDLIESAEIYGPFVGRPGSVYAANLQRETLMKRRFLAHYQAAQRQDRDAKVLLKFGANHLMRGLSATHVPSLGNFAADTAVGMRRNVVNLHMLCGPKAELRGIDNKPASCAEDFEPFAALRPYLKPGTYTLFDLRPLRDRPKLIKEWPQVAKDMVWAYDSLLVVANAGASEFLAPAMP